jgi:ABC-type sugar transport system ATPase subunit
LTLTDPPLEPTPILETRDVSKRFGGIYAVHHVSVSVRPREIVGLVGANGAGKSTLLRIIAGAIRPDGGHVRLLGQVLPPGDPVAAAHQGIAAVYQELSILPGLSVAENLYLGTYPTKRGVIPWRSLRREARNLFASLEVDLPINQPAGQLSLADRYLLEIARAVRRDPRVLILDEPTAALDVVDVERIFTIVRSLARRGTAIIFVSHRLAEVTAITERVIVMRDGNHVGGGRTADLNHDELISLMAAESAQWLAGSVSRAPQAPKGATTVRIGVAQVSTDVLRSVDFAAHKGEVVGLTGLRGSGTTDLCRVLAGATVPQRGQVVIDGEFVRLRSPFHALAQGIGYVPAERKSQGLFLQLNVRENIIIPALAKERKHLIRPSWERALTERSVSALNIRLPELGTSSFVSLLSGGNQQKVVLAKWLASKVDVLILDEPTRGVDIATKPQISLLLQELAKSGMTVIVSSSELPELYDMTDRIVVLHRGRVAGEVQGPSFDEGEILRYALGAGREWSGTYVRKEVGEVA